MRVHAGSVELLKFARLLQLYVHVHVNCNTPAASGGAVAGTHVGSTRSVCHQMRSFVNNVSSAGQSDSGKRLVLLKT